MPAAGRGRPRSGVLARSSRVGSESPDGDESGVGVGVGVGGLVPGGLFVGLCCLLLARPGTAWELRGSGLQDRLLFTLLPFFKKLLIFIIVCMSKLRRWLVGVSPLLPMCGYRGSKLTWLAASLLPTEPSCRPTNI